MTLQRTFSADAGDRSTDPGKGPDTIENDFDAIIALLNKISESITDGDSGADNVALTAISPFTSTKLQTFLEDLIARLKSTTDANSGADLIGATAVTDLSGTTVQALLEDLRNKLKSTTDGSSGADFVNATGITGLTGTTVQALLESLKSFIDTHKSAGTLDHPDASVVTAKLRDLAVTTAKIADEAVTANKLDSTLLEQVGINQHRFVTPIDHPDGSITDVKLSDDPAQIKQQFDKHLADVFVSGFVVSGMEASKDADTANQLNVTAGACYVLRDDSLHRFIPDAASFTTSTASTAYYLDFQPDGTYSWGTAHSSQANYLPIAEVATDVNGNISTVTDKRPLTPGTGKVNANLVQGRNLVKEHGVFLWLGGMF